MKRQFFAIPLLLITFCFVFSTKSFALSCCPNGTAIVPSGTGCTYGVQFQCVAPEPLCNKATNICVGEDSDACGAHGQKCCGNTCDDDLYCIFPGEFSEECVTEEEASLIPGNNPIGNDPVNIGPYCTPGVKESGIRTALGCIKFGNDSAPNELITYILRFATGIGGGLALALILYGVFVVTTSAGMPDKLKAGSEVITSAVIGLIFILISVFLVNLIGINILGIPGLS